MTLCLGMTGEYVKSVQEFLGGESLYRGPIDSSYGGGTFAAVKSFQLKRGLPVTGIVDGATWALMFPGRPAPISELLTKPLSERCLALTGSFETSTFPPESFCGLSGDFDRMGISFGVCQWNIGQRTLQPLLERMFEEHEEVARSIFHENFAVVSSLKTASLTEQLAFSRSIQSKGEVVEPWRGMFRSLGRTPEFQDIQTAAAADLFSRGLDLCSRYGLRSERGAALMFDIVTQNGSIDSAASERIHKAMSELGAGDDNEVARMSIVANYVAESAASGHVEDVRARKLAIAQGSGTVHGRYYELSDVFGISLTTF